MSSEAPRTADVQEEEPMDVDSRKSRLASLSAVTATPSRGLPFPGKLVGGVYAAEEQVGELLGLTSKRVRR